MLGYVAHVYNWAALKAGSGIRKTEPESRNRNPETGIQKKLQDSAIRLYNNCLETMSTKMLYFSIRDTKDKNSN